MNPVLSQILGLMLGLVTAIGCIAYEKLVMRCSLPFTVLAGLFFTVPFSGAMLVFGISSLRTDWTLATPETRWWALVYCLSWVSTPLWYFLTRRQGVMVGAVYEVKYVVILAGAYWLFGDKPMSANLLIGLCLALVSIWFVSRS
jgi:drug/metabolite transporter (DMT)-like permease